MKVLIYLLTVDDAPPANLFLRLAEEVGRGWRKKWEGHFSIDVAL
jgi:hypothetical protein